MPIYESNILVFIFYFFILLIFLVFIVDEYLVVAKDKFGYAIEFCILLIFLDL